MTMGYDKPLCQQSDRDQWVIREMTMNWTTMEGTPFPLGATWVEEGLGVELRPLLQGCGRALRCCSTRKRTWSIPCSRTTSTTSATSRGGSGTAGSPKALLRGARYYAYSVAGPEPQGGFAWHCFDPDKVLLDPYAKAVFFPPTSTGRRLRVPVPTPARRPWACSPVPASRSTGATTDGHGISRTPSSTSCTSGGFTNNPNSGVSPERRGTYAGVVEKIPYLKDLGITAVELMPVFQFDPQEGSCWGYMPLNFFAPHHGYSSRPKSATSTTSSAPWSRRCTPRTSRSSSTWSTTTRPKATSEGRSTASRGSTTAPTT